MLLGRAAYILMYMYTHVCEYKSYIFIRIHIYVCMLCSWAFGPGGLPRLVLAAWRRKVLTNALPGTSMKGFLEAAQNTDLDNYKHLDIDVNVV